MRGRDPHAALVAPAIAAVARQPEPHGGGHRRAAGGAGRRAPGCGQCLGVPDGLAAGGLQSTRRRSRAVGPMPRRPVQHRERPHESPSTRPPTAPFLTGRLQRRPRHHGGLPPAGRVGGAEPGQRPGRPSQPDPGADQGAGHGADRQPQRRGVRRRQPGQRAQPGGGRQDQRRAVPRSRAVWRAGTEPSFTDALGKVEVRPGARIDTHAPGSVTQGGDTHAPGSVTQGGGYAAAGRRGAQRRRDQRRAGRRSRRRATSGAAWAPARTPCRPRGQRSPRLAANQDGGLVRNTGLIVAAEGDVTLAGRQVRAWRWPRPPRTRGTIHLLNSA